MADQLHGVTITYQSSLLAEIVSVDWTGMARTPVDTTHSGTSTWMTSRPSDLVKAGVIGVTGYLDHDKDYKTAITAAAETITVTFPLDTSETSAATWACSGYMTEFSFTGGTRDDGAAEFTCALELSGEPTFTAAT